MKTNQTFENNSSVKQASFSSVCLASCRKLVTRIEQAKNNLVAEFRDTFAAHEQLLNQAIGEAEALAWQTPYPHLFFATLATEKVQAAAAWSAHQQHVKRNQLAYAIAA